MFHLKKRYTQGFAAIVLSLGVFLYSQPAMAAYDYQFEAQPRQLGTYEHQVGEKATRGLTNVALGWTELGLTPTRWAQDPRRGNAGAIFLGIPYGIVRTVGRTLTGVYEVLTAYAPQEPIFYPLEGDKF